MTGTIGGDVHTQALCVLFFQAGGGKWIQCVKHFSIHSNRPNPIFHLVICWYAVKLQAFVSCVTQWKLCLFVLWCDSLCVCSRRWARSPHTAVSSFSSPSWALMENTRTNTTNLTSSTNTTRTGSHLTHGRARPQVRASGVCRTLWTSDRGKCVRDVSKFSIYKKALEKCSLLCSRSQLAWFQRAVLFGMCVIVRISVFIMKASYWNSSSNESKSSPETQTFHSSDSCVCVESDPALYFESVCDCRREGKSHNRC